MPDSAVPALPRPIVDGGPSLHALLARRRTVRAYDTAAPLSLADAAQLLWSAQGVTEPALGYRTAPSAGPVFPFETDLVAGAVDGLAAGVYRYDPAAHAIARRGEGDRRADVVGVSFNHAWLSDAPAFIVLSMIVERMAPKYGAAGERFALLEGGHIAQNILLEAEALGLGAAPICAYDGAKLRAVLGLATNEDPVYLLCVGHTRPQGGAS